MASIEKRGKNSYRLVVELGYDANGKRIRRTKTVHCKNKREAEIELAKFVAEVEAGEYIRPEKMTFSDFVNEWREKFASKHYSPLTLVTYERHLKNHIIPAIGHKRLDEIKTIHLVSFLDELSKPGARKDGRGEKLSNRTIDYIYDVMQSVFKLAKEWKLIKSNPLEGVKPPKVVKKEMSFYSEDEAMEVIRCLYQEPRMWRVFFLAAMLGGFRRGELIALEWSDVNFDDLTISVRKSISLTENGQAIEKEAKTKSSMDKVDMPEWFMDEMKEYYHEWKVEKLKVGDRWQGGDRQYVFHSGFGKPLYHSTPTQMWKKFIQRHGLKYVRLHDLRHTAATLLLENDTDLKTIQKRLRHAQFQTTAEFYTHVTEKLSKRTAEKLNKFDPRNRKIQ